MTHHLTIGIDPGLTGAIAALHDGARPALHDMPLMRRRAKGSQLNAAELAALLREIRSRCPGATVHAVIEDVAARPGQGVTSMFRFGESLGVIRGVVCALGIPLTQVAPTRWKSAMNLAGTDKDFARTRAIELYPEAASQLARKKDGGRADALLIARWAYLFEVQTLKAAA